MGVLPVPDEIKDMASGIRTLAKAVEDQGKMLDKIHVELADMKATLVRSDLGTKLDAIHGTLTTSKDILRLLSSLMEKKL